MNSPNSWIDGSSFGDLAKGLAGPAGSPSSDAGERLPVTRLSPEDFRLPDHFLPAPFPSPSDAERAKARERLEAIRGKAELNGLLPKPKPADAPAPAAPETPDKDVPPPVTTPVEERPPVAEAPSSPSLSPPPPSSEPVPPPPLSPPVVAPASSFSTASPPGKAVPLPRRITPFEPPLGPLTTRVRALGDWIRRQTGALEMFVLDPDGRPVCDRRPAPAFLSAAMILAEAAHQALQDLPAGESGAVTLDLNGERKFCVIQAEMKDGRYRLCLTVTEALSNRAAERLRRALRRAVEPGE